MVGKIYKITNILNYKCYIGKTFISISRRFKQHIQDSKREDRKNRPLYSAINKYGESNFIIEVIGEYEEDILNEKEIEFIKFYNSYSNGYNATLGGDGKRYFNYSNEEVIDAYYELKTVKAVAEKYSCDIATISKILKNSGIEVIRNFNVKYFCPELNIYFDSFQELVDYLKEKKIVNTSNDDSIKRSICRVIQGTRESYYKLTFVKIS